MITLDDPTLEREPDADPTTGGAAMRQYLRWGLAMLSLGAAGIHLAMMGDHFNETWYHGSFFAATAWLQLAWAVAIVVKPARKLLLAGIVGNLAIAQVWLVSRTIGIPFGPNSGNAEAVAFADVLATILEVGIVLGSLALLRPQFFDRPVRAATAVPGVAGVGVLVAALATLSLTPAFASGHGHAGEAAAGHGHGKVADRAKAAGGTGAAETAAGVPGGHTHANAPAQGNIGVRNVDQAAELQPDKPLDPATRAALATQLTAAREAALRYPTLADARAAGMFPAGEFTPGAGAHYLTAGGAASSFLGKGQFDAASPATWIYDGMSPSSRVVGLMWISGAKDAPEGFAGPNDHWHRHFNTCIRSGKNGIAGIEVPFAADQDVTREMCEGVGGTFMDTTVWMVHAWVVPSWDSPHGVFSHDNPNLLCADGTAKTDERGFCQGT